MTRCGRIAPTALALLFSSVATLAAVEPEHQATRDLIDFVNRGAAEVERQGLAACEAFRKADGPWFHGEAYLFILDFDGGAHCHPARPILEGRNLIELRDPDGKPIVDLFIRQLARGQAEGWVHYLWPRPGETVLTWKSSYVRRVQAPDGKPYIVGSGVYNLPMEKLFMVDRVEEAAALIWAEGKQAFATLRDRAGGFIFYDAYVFVMSEEGVELVNPAFPGLEGRNVVEEIQNPDGSYPARALLEAVAGKESAWAEYQWPRPNEEKLSRKLAYLKKVRVGDQVLIVGAGIYPGPRAAR